MSKTTTATTGRLVNDANGYAVYVDDDNDALDAGMSDADWAFWAEVERAEIAKAVQS